MAVDVMPCTMLGGVTPVCGRCGLALCWDLSDSDYEANREFWDEWVCQECNGGTPMSLKAWRAERSARG